MNDERKTKTASFRAGLAWPAGSRSLCWSCLLAWAGWYALHAWNALAGVDISPMGWFFIVVGILSPSVSAAD